MNFFKKSLNVENLRVFGSLCFATSFSSSDKFSERAEKCILLGYSSDKKGYKLLSLDPNSIFCSWGHKVLRVYFSFQVKIN